MNNLRWEPGLTINATTPATNLFPSTNRNLFNTLTTELIRTFSEPVTVAPTAEQIRASTITLAYSEIEDPLNHQCPISLELFQPNTIVTQIRHCKHAFMPNSFQTWFASNVRCPICRHDIRDNISSETEGINTNNIQSSTNVTDDTDNFDDNSLNDLPPLIPINENENSQQDIEMGPETETEIEPEPILIPPPVPEPIPQRPEHLNTTNNTSTQNDEFTNAVETMLNDAVRHMINEPNTTQQDGSNNMFSPLNLNTRAIGSAIFNNIMNNNFQNFEYDPSNNAVRFETVVFDTSWNPT